ncbi:hypothetical protein HanXRQr2_Chr06g0263411 [Helianthus annuus]|uniref:Uncharacterized protein n=1 Tax=Helianthus annuus TaxID=4232 RepID=A0A9K3IU16_HELAN|nr:hypothetical protein HanXRQr2_Chr06g0263411 [Helianthus annuus]KAJ0915804.1 hypothetical protein HanPSC8_Chr06g0254081 [Helianthus annuus]
MMSRKHPYQSWISYSAAQGMNRRRIKKVTFFYYIMIGQKPCMFHANNCVDLFEAQEPKQ